jgi:glycosyltransferase involved in cell wall biosynthesis
MAGRPTRVLVLTADKVGGAMAGPAIRAVELARVLDRSFEVVLGSTHEVSLAGLPFRSMTVRERLDLEPHVDWADVVVAMPSLLHRFDWIADHDLVVVADAYDPVLFEVLEWFAPAAPQEQDARFLDALAQMIEPLRFADAVLCASERQRHLLIGLLTAIGRVNPRTYGEDPTLGRLVPVVPFGLPADPPRTEHRPLRGPGGPFAADDVVLYWGGGIYQWLDPLTLIEAMALVDDPNVKLFFAGIAHPTPEVPVMPMAQAARDAATDRGLIGTRVVFSDRWISYGERAAYLSDADIGVSVHRRHVETTFSFRTRLLDYLWAGLPILTSEGDSFAELVRAHELGAVVPAEDAAAMAEAIGRLRDRELRAACSRRVLDLAPAYEWSVVSRPLVELCAEPRRAADRLAGGRAQPVAPAALPAPGLTGLLQRVAARARSALRSGE